MVLLIALITFVPLGIAWYFAQHPELVRDRKRLNHGNLIDPARPQDYGDFFQRPISPADTLPEIKGHWVMLQISSGSGCNQACRDTAYKSGQIRLMLNKEITRVRRLLLISAAGEPTQTAELGTADPTLLMVELNDHLKQQLESAVGAGLSDGMLILMDPFANVMMWYPAGFDPYDVLKDLQRLLRISQIG
jgi:hypothetical protein